MRPATETLTVASARYRTRGEWRVNGTSDIKAGQKVAIVLGSKVNATGAPTLASARGVVIGFATVDTLGAWSYVGTGPNPTHRTGDHDSDRGLGTGRAGHRPHHGHRLTTPGPPHLGLDPRPGRRSHAVRPGGCVSRCVNSGPGQWNWLPDAGSGNHERSNVMQMSRREALMAGGLGILGVGGLAVPLGAGLQAKAASRLATRNMPVPYAAAFIRPPVLPYTALHDAEGPYRLYTVTEQRAMARIVNGLDTPVYAYNGIFPARPSRCPRAPASSCGCATSCRRCTPPSAPVQHLDPPARLGVAAAVRRVRQRHHPPRSQELPVPELAAGPHPLVPRPQRAHTAQNVVLGPGRAVPPPDPCERALLPAGRVTTSAPDLGHDVQADGSLAYDDNRPRRACGATSSWSTAGRGR